MLVGKFLTGKNPKEIINFRNKELWTTKGYIHSMNATKYLLHKEMINDLYN